MTTEHEASRTLVKSPPELWAECSDAGSLARHLGEFGEIKITRLDPETTVAWEGERASGTVRIEPSGWGTRVTLTAQTKTDGLRAEEADPSVKADEPTPVEAGEAPPQVDEPAPSGLREDTAGLADDISGLQGAPAPPEEGVMETVGESPTGGSHPDEETNDATVEETPEDAGPEPLADSRGNRARWRRLTSRMRELFGSAEATQQATPREDPVTSPPAAGQEGLGSPKTDEPPRVEEARAGEEPAAPEPLAEPQMGAAPEPWADQQPPAEPHLPAELEPAADDAGEPAADDAAPATPGPDAEAILTSALDSLGQAHHRPFSRA